MILIDPSVWIRFLANKAPYARKASLVPDSEVAAFVRDRGLNGSGIGWIDAHLIASALVGRFQLWTADKKLSSVAKELGVGYL